MRKKIQVIVVLLMCVFLVMIIISLVTSRSYYNETMPVRAMQQCTIYATDQALTFARYRKDNALHLMLVLSYEEGGVKGVDLTVHGQQAIVDPIRYFNRYGYEAVRKKGFSAKRTITVHVNELVLPADFHQHNIGIGLNYSSHAREVRTQGGPFVFPKISRPVHFFSSIPTGSLRLPDYEVELGFVTLGTINEQEGGPEYLGFILANDMTDRWPIVRSSLSRMCGFSGPEEAGIRGYTSAKKFPASLPVGNFLVIPRDYQQYYKEIVLRLYRNGQLRQETSAARMQWGPLACIREIFKRKAWKYQSEEGMVTLLPSGSSIPPATIILSGTPEGVIIKKTNWWNPLLYLRPGEQLSLKANGLGIIRNKIVE